MDTVNYTVTGGYLRLLSLDRRHTTSSNKQRERAHPSGCASRDVDVTKSEERARDSVGKMGCLAESNFARYNRTRTGAAPYLRETVPQAGLSISSILIARESDSPLGSSFPILENICLCEKRP